MLVGCIGAELEDKWKLQSCGCKRLVFFSTIPHNYDMGGLHINDLYTIPRDQIYYLLRFWGYKMTDNCTMSIYLFSYDL